MQEQDKIMLPSLREKETELPTINGNLIEELKLVMHQSQPFQEMLSLIHISEPTRP